MVRTLRHLLKYVGINALGKRAYAFYVEPWLTQMPLHTLRMLSDLEEFWAIKPLLSETPGRGPVLVLAPHQDDEIIGAGGSLIKHVIRGDHVRVIYLTDGGFSELCIGPINHVNEYLKRRGEEARLVCKALGASEPVFYSLPNRPEWMMSHMDELTERMQQSIEAEQPRLVYIPFILDNQHMHRLANVALAQAVQRLRRPTFDICGYSVWSLMPANVAVDITYELSKKLTLLALYSSQYPFSCDYINYTEGMNRYQTRFVMRTERSGSGLGAVECFFRLPARDYAGIVLKHAEDIVGGLGLADG